ncbi:MAG: O-antigen ligase family protein [Clostridia bacterium]|nr:O-antigen ligase family protein [Clostridia bacterium]
MEQFETRKGLMLIFILTNVFLLFIRDVFLISLPKVIFLVVEVSFLFFANHSEMIEMLCFLFPLLCGLPANYLMLAALILYFIKTPGINKSQVLAICVFSLLEVFASFGYRQFDYKELFGYIAHISVFFVIMFDENIHVKECVQNYIWGTTLCLSIIVLFSFRHAPSNWVYLLSKGWFRIGQFRVEDGVHISLNPNSVSMFSAVAVMLSIGLLYTSKKYKGIIIACICILVVAAVFSLSRAWFVVMAVFFALLFWTRKKSVKSLVIMISILVLAVGLGLIIVRQVPEVFEGFIARVNESDVADGEGNRRVYLVYEYIEAFFSYPDVYLFGAGVIKPNYRLNIPVGESSHTSLVQLLVDLGILGFIMFIGLWGVSVKDRYLSGKKYNSSNQGIQIAAFAGCFLYSLTGQIINPYYMLFPHLIMTLALSLREENHEQENECQEGVSSLRKTTSKYIIH